MTWTFLGFLLSLYIIFDHLVPLSSTLKSDCGATRSQFRAVDHQDCAHLVRTNIRYSPFGAPLWGEGCVIAMDDTRAGHSSSPSNLEVPAKPHGLGPHQIFGSHQTGLQREVCKRSYKRALHRAAQHGVTWYKGRLFTASQMGVTLKPSTPMKQVKNVLPSKSTQRRRLTCFSWNCNGLPPAHWDFLMMWLGKPDD